MCYNKRRNCDIYREKHVMKTYFDEVKKNFGFGFMRLPLLGNGEIDCNQTKQMVDLFLENGFNYFDTAHGYLSGKSEIALRECLVERYPRDSFVLANKLTASYFNTEADIKPFFFSQLKICGVDFFDFYLMHAQSRENYSHFKDCRAYEQAFELKAAGKIKHVGLSFHDTSDFLDKILTDYPAVEFVQIQFNYLDCDDPAVQSRQCYEVCRRHGKPVIVMEPVKGGNLVNLPQKAADVFAELKSGSAASYAIRYAAGFDGIFMTLSGMSNLEQMRDNISFMKDFRPLSDKENDAVKRVKSIFAEMHSIPCTACRYCVDGCPKSISIPDLFACKNAQNIHNDWNSKFYYKQRTARGGKASDCIECGKCEKVCPQHLPVRKLLKELAAQFEVPDTDEDD